MINFGVSLFSGILAAFSPCVAVLIPIVFYRFIQQSENKWFSLARFSAAYTLTFIVTAVFISALFDSSVRNGFQLGLGLMFIALGILDLMGRFNAMKFPLVKSPELLGIIFAFMSAVNPCTFSYLGVLIGTVHRSLWLHLVFFGFGMLLPAVAFLIFGDRLLSFVGKQGALMAKVGKAVTVLLILVGVYMAVTIKSFGGFDVILTAVMLIFVMVVILRAFFEIKKFKDILTPDRIFLIIALLIIIFAVSYHCNALAVKTAPPPQQLTFEQLALGSQGHQCCVGYNGSCEVCTRCIGLFSLALVVGGFAILFSAILQKKRAKNKPKNQF